MPTEHIKDPYDDNNKILFPKPIKEIEYSSCPAFPCERIHDNLTVEEYKQICKDCEDSLSKDPPGKNNKKYATFRYE